MGGSGKWKSAATATAAPTETATATAEEKFATNYKETRKHFVARLRRTILRIPKEFLTKLVGAMKKRSQLVKDAKGFHFEEGS